MAKVYIECRDKGFGWAQGRGFWGLIVRDCCLGVRIEGLPCRV